MKRKPMNGGGHIKKKVTEIHNTHHYRKNMCNLASEFKDNDRSGDGVGDSPC